MTIFKRKKYTELFKNKENIDKIGRNKITKERYEFFGLNHDKKDKSKYEALLRYIKKKEADSEDICCACLQTREESRSMFMKADCGHFICARDLIRWSNIRVSINLKKYFF